MKRNIFNKKIFMSIVCLLFVAIIPLCSINLYNYSQALFSTSQGDTLDEENGSESDEDLTNAGEIVDDDKDDANTDNETEDNDDVATTASGYWTSYATKPNQVGTTYMIDSASDLAWIATQSPFDGNIQLAANIDLSAHFWVPMAAFGGTFNGRGYTISGLSIKYTQSEPVGLFGRILEYSNATISNVIIEGEIYITATGSCVGVGSLVGRLDPGSRLTMQNCVNKVDIDVTTTKLDVGIGGLVGWFDEDYGDNGGYAIQISQSMNLGDINVKVSSNTWQRVGGILGYSRDHIYISNCINYGNISNAGYYTGGIVGLTGARNCNRWYEGNSYVNTAGDTMYINRCVNLGSVSTTSGQNSVGGIAGQTHIEGWEIVTDPEFGLVSNCIANASGDGSFIVGSLNCNSPATGTASTYFVNNRFNSHTRYYDVNESQWVWWPPHTDILNWWVVYLPYKEVDYRLSFWNTIQSYALSIGACPDSYYYYIVNDVYNNDTYPSSRVPNPYKSTTYIMKNDNLGFSYSDENNSRTWTGIKARNMPSDVTLSHYVKDMEIKVKIWEDGELVDFKGNDFKLASTGNGLFRDHSYLYDFYSTVSAGRLTAFNMMNMGGYAVTVYETDYSKENDLGDVIKDTSTATRIEYALTGTGLNQGTYSDAFDDITIVLELEEMVEISDDFFRVWTSRSLYDGSTYFPSDLELSKEGLYTISISINNQPYVEGSGYKVDSTVSITITPNAKFEILGVYTHEDFDDKRGRVDRRLTHFNDMTYEGVEGEEETRQRVTSQWYTQYSGLTLSFKMSDLIIDYEITGEGEDQKVEFTYPSGFDIVFVAYRQDYNLSVNYQGSGFEDYYLEKGYSSRAKYAERTSYATKGKICRKNKLRN